MRRIIIAGATLATMLAPAAIGACAASAEENGLFSWSGTAGALLLITADGKQLIGIGEAKIECNTVKLDGTLKSTDLLALVAKGTESGCVAFGGHTATVSEVEFEFGDDEVLSITGKAVSIAVPSLKCTVKLEHGGTNKELKLVAYSNSGSGILAGDEVEGITSTTEGGGGSCGAEGKAETKDTITGLVLAKADATGTLKFTCGEFACSLGAVVLPSPLLVKGVGMVSQEKEGKVFMDGPASYEILEQKFVGGAPGSFELKDSCAGQNFTVPAEQHRVCTFKVNGAGGLFTEGLSTTLETKWQFRNGWIERAISTGVRMEN